MLRQQRPVNVDPASCGDLQDFLPQDRGKSTDADQIGTDLIPCQIIDETLLLPRIERIDAQVLSPREIDKWRRGAALPEMRLALARHHDACDRCAAMEHL